MAVEWRAVEVATEEGQAEAMRITEKQRKSDFFFHLRTKPTSFRDLGQIHTQNVKPLTATAKYAASVEPSHHESNKFEMRNETNDH